MVTTRGMQAAHAEAKGSNWMLAGFLLIAGALLIYALAWAQGDPTGRGLFIGPLVVLLCTPWILRLRESPRAFDLAGLVLSALGVKLIGVYARFWMVDSLYDGVGDSTSYDTYGRQFAPLFRSFNFDVDPGRPIPGTGWPRVLTGIVP